MLTWKNIYLYEKRKILYPSRTTKTLNTTVGNINALKKNAVNIIATEDKMRQDTYFPNQ